MGERHECSVDGNLVMERASDFWPLVIFISGTSLNIHTVAEIIIFELVFFPFAKQ